ncbi:MULTISPECIES: sensor domain-containing diguanylate cyclase [unclassified Aeromonas]|uniref:sensor domain-containing diguanylate cyclase n=1 Tax=unclassified Aeromonas TaxID=257493 RepID=UPI001C4816CB|nr:MULTISPECIES: sensor domain-containing diguanylate cyclase [unclassified Aeromonas]MBV7416504.1 diguanylate cyclase [Aeromonas sp. sif2433]MBV7600014.1 diguanylate cyclase [Aeromonas sp. sia0103]
MLPDTDTIKISDVSEGVVHGILEVISEGVWDWNANTGFVYRNSGWYRMLGYEPHSLGNTVFTWENVIHPDDLTRVMACFDAYLSGEAPHYKVEYRCRTRDGDFAWVEDYGRIIARNPDGSVARMIGAHRDIHAQKLLYTRLELQNRSLEQQVAERTAELQRLNRELQRQVEENRRLAETDSLTGAASRYRLEQVIRLESERAKRFKDHFSVIAMDVDDFKRINDRYGHAVGDQTLIDIVRLARDNIREIDLIARWGGDEFMLILPNTRLPDAQVVAEKLRQRLSQLSVGEQEGITMSFGLVEYHLSESQSQLMVRVDRALYQAKLSGKNQLCGWH